MSKVQAAIELSKQLCSYPWFKSVVVYGNGLVVYVAVTTSKSAKTNIPSKYKGFTVLVEEASKGK